MKNKTWMILPFALASILSAGCFKEIPPASVGVKFNASSGISEQIMKPQVVFVGLRDHLIIYPTSVRSATYTKTSHEGERTGDDSISASTVEGSNLPIDMTVSYHVEPADVRKCFENFGDDSLPEIQKDFIRWTTIYAVNVVSGSKSIFDLTSKDRATLGTDVKKVIAPILGEWGITVDDIFVGEVYPNQQVRGKVEERISMKNAFELAKVGLERARIDAQTTLTNARKEADLNRLMAMQGDKVLQLKKLELQRLAIERWNGRSPLIGSSTIPFTDLELK